MFPADPKAPRKKRKTASPSAADPEAPRRKRQNVERVEDKKAPEAKATSSIPWLGCWNHKRLNLEVLVLIGEKLWYDKKVPKVAEEWRELSNQVNTFTWGLFKFFSKLKDAYAKGKGHDFPDWLMQDGNPYKHLSIALLRMTTSRNDVLFENAPRILCLWNAMYMYLMQMGVPETDDLTATSLRASLIGFLTSAAVKAQIRARAIWFFTVLEVLRIATCSNVVGNKFLDMNLYAQKLEDLRTADPATAVGQLMNGEKITFFSRTIPRC